MIIIELKEKERVLTNTKLSQTYIRFKELLSELRIRELPHTVIERINQDVEELNLTFLNGDELRKLIERKQTKIIQMLEKELKIVPKNYYQNYWLAIGMTAFGLPIGVVYGLCIMNNIGMLAIGLPIGMGIGVCLGSWLDKKSFKEGRQLNVKIDKTF